MMTGWCWTIQIDSGGWVRRCHCVAAQHLYEAAPIGGGLCPEVQIKNTQHGWVQAIDHSSDDPRSDASRGGRNCGKQQGLYQILSHQHGNGGNKNYDEPAKKILVQEPLAKSEGVSKAQIFSGRCGNGKGEDDNDVNSGN